MSWQAYVDTSLVGTGKIDKAAIYGVDGTGPWATSAGYNISPAEMKTVAGAFNDKGDANGVKKVQASGLHLAGEKYLTLRADDRSLYVKKGKEGAVIVKTKQSILVGHYPESTQPGDAATTVEKLGDYLISVGY